ncbi:MFS transporter [Mesorhizobium sp. WSM4906]|uniref:MFS transporter n=1 Tax=Mesorhizobium sp. WSM4906 TaxID=3038546 RepID=UPI0024176AAD|nr:MFS transporter [Mesorhizobium sp. WSM4906]WFP75917.1 MFS transporter [Mesorhizobium sp. WSM4906]
MAEGAEGNTLLDDDRPNTEQNVSTAASWYTVIVLCLALLISFTDRLVINLVVDPIRADLILTDFEVSLLQGAGFAVIFALATLPCGRLADWANRRNVIMTGIALWSVATIACGVAGDFRSFFAARVAVGLGEAALIPAASALIFDSFSSRRRGIALGIFSLGAAFGTGVAMFVGGGRLRQVKRLSSSGWRIFDADFAHSRRSPILPTLTVLLGVTWVWTSDL